MIEIIGLAGSGKSSTIKYLKAHNVLFEDSLPYKKVDFFILTKWYIIIRIFMKTKDVRHIKEFIVIQMLFKSIRKNNNLKTICFDQGPLFMLMKLVFDIPSLENIFYNEIMKILPYYDKVIYLYAPFEVIKNRIDTRNQDHRIKNKSLEAQYDFLRTYENLFNKLINLCQVEGIEIIKIDTDKHTIKEVGELVINEIYKR